MSEEIMPADMVEPPPARKPAKLESAEGEDASCLVPGEYQGAVQLVSMETCEEVQDSAELRELGIAGIPVLGLHTARPRLSPGDAAACRPMRRTGFALLGCTKKELTDKQKEIAAARAAALKKGGA